MAHGDDGGTATDQHRSTSRGTRGAHKDTSRSRTSRKNRKDPDDNKKGARSWLGLGTLAAILITLAAYGGFLWYSSPDVEGEPLQLGEFVQLAEEGRVHQATILDHDGIVAGTYERADGETARFRTEYFRDGQRENLSDVLLRNFVPFDIDQQFLKTLWLPATLFTPAIVIVIVFIYLIASYRRGTGLFGLTSGARRIDAADADVTFDDVAGQQGAVAELRELADFLATPERFTSLGAHVPKGVLVFGPPGCGKTLLAKALAGESGAAFYSISGSDFVELYVGVGASRVRDLFREARENAPAIVFIDELDSIGAKRSTGGAQAGSSGEQEQALNQILAEMDGFSPTDGLLVVAATNRPDVLDPALLRPGRFDRSVGLERPDERGRAEILAVHTKDVPLAADVDLAAIARDAVGMTGADLANVANEAALLAGRASNTQVGHAELTQALTRILEAPERQRRLAMRDRELGHGTLAEERVTFADVAGVEEAIEEFSEVRDFLAEPERFEALGARMPRGFLLSGPPGCGKTLLARAVAGEANAAFVSVAATEFVERYVGEGAGRVRDLFAQVKAIAPAILFIDELDALGKRHEGSATGAERERDQTLNQLLVELDGFGPRTGVVVMAATNRPDMIDDALLRPGRFDRRVAFNLPDRAARREILGVHAGSMALADDLDLDLVATRTRGLSGADLANVLNEAALLAARRREPAVSNELIEEALDRVSMGVARERLLSDAERRKVAYHETGHALVARTLDSGKLPHKVSIVARGHMLGATTMIDGSESQGALRSRSQLVDDMAIALGGRAAEELVFGEPDAGSADDLSRATTVARRMVTQLGMSERLGALTYAGTGTAAHGPETMTLIDTEARALVDEAFDLARAVLVANWTAMEAVAAGLAERETLTAPDLDALAGDAHPPSTTGASSAGRSGRQRGDGARPPRRPQAAGS